MTITNSALLVEMNISVWTAARVDKTATRKVAADANATDDAGLYRKNLMAGSTDRKEIADYAAMCRTWHNSRTLPWSDKGMRLIPLSMLFDYKAEVNARQARFDAMVTKFLDKYTTHVATAQQHLGSLFDPADYPPVGEVANKFAYRLVFSPVPDAGDFRLDIAEADKAMLEGQYKNAYDERINEAMRTTWGKLHSMLTGMSEKLTELDDTDGKGKLFHTTFVSNAVELCSLLTHLNITKDAQLERARRDLERAITGVDIDDIRKHAEVREEIKAKVDAVLKGYEW